MAEKETTRAFRQFILLDQCLQRRDVFSLQFQFAAVQFVPWLTGPRLEQSLHELLQLGMFAPDELWLNVSCILLRQPGVSVLVKAHGNWWLVFAVEKNRQNSGRDGWIGRIGRGVFEVAIIGVDFEHHAVAVDLNHAKLMRLVGIVVRVEIVKTPHGIDDTGYGFALQSIDARRHQNPATGEGLAELVVQAADLPRVRIQFFALFWKAVRCFGHLVGIMSGEA